MFFTLLNVVLPVFIVVALGYLLTYRKMLNEAQIDGLMQFAQGVAIPILLFRAMVSFDFDAGFEPSLMITYYTSATIGFLAGALGARLFFGRPWEDCVVIGFCCLFANTLLLGVSITERAFGPDSLTGNYAILAVHSPFCYGIGITAMEVLRNRDKGGLRILTAVFKAMFKNMLIMAILSGFVVNLSGFSIPTPLDDALAMIARAGLPLALFALGGVMVRYRPEGDLRTIAMVCIIVLILQPAVVWVLGTQLNVPHELFRSALVTAAMAPGVNCYVFANMYGRAKRVAASSVLLATALSIITILGWLSLLH